jgi:hypothetical protein
MSNPHEGDRRTTTRRKGDRELLDSLGELGEEIERLTFLVVFGKTDQKDVN